MIIVKPVSSAVGSPDRDVILCQRLQTELARQPWCKDATAQLFVEDGHVTVEGLATDDTLARALCTVARNVAGADKVRDAMVRIGMDSVSALMIE